MYRVFFFICFLSICTQSTAAGSFRAQLTNPRVIIANIPTEITISLYDASGPVSDVTVAVDGLLTYENNKSVGIDSLQFVDGMCRVKNVFLARNTSLQLRFAETEIKVSVRVIPGWLSLLPPIMAILLALVARQVLVALFVGVWLGTAIIYDYNPFSGFLYSLTEYIGRAPADPDKMAILIFSLTLGGMVGVISKMGGTHGIVERLSQFASDSRRGQFVTWLMGVFVFFDDYANTLIVGSTMRPLSDRLRISREKLSYLVDSTAAPVANIAIISTWIGFELSLISSAFDNLGITQNAYLTFFKTIPYNFYPIYALLIGLCIALMGRDFGPMLHAERRTKNTGHVLGMNANPISNLDAGEITASENISKRWYNGFIPIAVVIFSTLAGLWFTGLSSIKSSQLDTTDMGFIRYVSTVIGASDSYAVLMWASFIGSITAIILALFQKILNLEESIRAWVGGIKAMVLAALILTMAWSIGNICSDLRTADYIIHISEGLLSAHLIPLLSFIIAAVISFATGTSWGVMAILMPIVIPLSYLLPQSDSTINEINRQSIFLSTIASVLAGATFGDHCSPISDTTIMSSMATGSDHIDHVRTQLPYALAAGFFSIIIGYLPVGFGISTYIILPLGILFIPFFIRFYARPV
jgi:Na+/H+ antiporter NhaC